jgi:hypothetical protein
MVNAKRLCPLLVRRGLSKKVRQGSQSVWVVVVLIMALRWGGKLGITEMALRCQEQQAIL